MGRVGGQFRQMGGLNLRRKARLGLEGRQGAIRMVAGGVARRHVSAGDGLHQVPQQQVAVLFRLALRQKLEEGHRPGLALAQEEGVHKRRQGLGVEESGHAAGQHQGVAGAALRGQQGNPGALQDLQDVRVVGLKGDGKGHRGEILQRPLGLQAQDGGAGAPVFLPILGTGEKSPFAVQAGGVIEQPVDGLEAQIPHGHRVNLRIDQGHGPAGAPVAHHRAFFLGKQFFQAGFELGRH